MKKINLLIFMVCALGVFCLLMNIDNLSDKISDSISDNINDYFIEEMLK